MSYAKAIKNIVKGGLTAAADTVDAVAEATDSKGLRIVAAAVDPEIHATCSRRISMVKSAAKTALDMPMSGRERLVADLDSGLRRPSSDVDCDGNCDCDCDDYLDGETFAYDETEWDEDDDDEGEYDDEMEQGQLIDEDLVIPPCTEGAIRVCGSKMEVQRGRPTGEVAYGSQEFVLSPHGHQDIAAHFGNLVDQHLDLDPADVVCDCSDTEIDQHLAGSYTAAFDDNGISYYECTDSKNNACSK